MKYLFTIILMTACFYSHASIIAFDDSSDSVYDGGFGYQNGGTGFAGWLWGGDWYHGLFEPYIDHGGKFIDQDTRGDRGFRVFSHDGYKVHASRTFSSSLNQDDLFSMNLGHIGGNDGTLHFAILANSNPILELELISGSSSCELGMVNILISMMKMDLQIILLLIIKMRNSHLLIMAEVAMGFH